MKRIFLAVWLLIPLAGVIYHLSAGEHHQKMDVIGDHLRTAQSLAQKSEWSEAVGEFEKALEELPEDADSERRELRLEVALAKMNAAGLPEAHEDLKKLLDELNDQEVKAPGDEAFEDRVRESLASAQYYITWLMRLEGLPREEWEPEIESSRQNYRLLAERAQQAGDSRAEARQLENLEASIRLARLELTDLQGLPIPSPCKCCCSGQCRARRQGPPKTGQTKDARGATAGPPADGKGS
jgi:tetratricopeptide (TPR) repeat protein